MLHVTKLRRAQCEFCKRNVLVICFWFDTEEGKKDYLEYLTQGLEKSEEMAGEFITHDSPVAEIFKVLSGRFIGYAYHMIARGEKEECQMSRKSPRDKKILEILVAEMERETSSGIDQRSINGKIHKRRRGPPEAGHYSKKIA